MNSQGSSGKKPPPSNKKYSHFDRMLIKCVQEQTKVHVEVAHELSFTDADCGFEAIPKQIDTYSVSFMIRDVETWIGKPFIVAVHKVE